MLLARLDRDGDDNHSCVHMNAPLPRLCFHSTTCSTCPLVTVPPITRRFGHAVIITTTAGSIRRRHGQPRLTLCTYHQLDAGAVYDVRGFVIQGRADVAQWVSSVKLETSVDGTNFMPVDGGYTFLGNNDQHTKVRQPFANAMIARYVRFYPQTWRAYMSMRSGLIVNNLPAEELFNPPACDRTMTTVHSGFACGTGSNRGDLDSAEGWVPSTNNGNDHMTLDLGEYRSVVGFVMQGRHGIYPQWVTRVQLSTSSNNIAYTVVGEFDGNSDQDTHATRIFPTATVARYVRFQPVTYEGYPSMRSALLVNDLSCCDSCFVQSHENDWYGYQCAA